LVSVNGLEKYGCYILSWPNLVCREVERGERRKKERRLRSRGGRGEGIEGEKDGKKKTERSKE